MSKLTMKIERIARQGLIGASAVALCFAPLVQPAAARAKVGVASAVIPQARLGDTAQELEIIAVGDRVDQDVLIETGKRGRTQVLFVDGSSMNIGPSSRIVIDEFVFDPSQLSGNLGARIEKGSMRFIGGVLSKRANQVKFDAGAATVGIRGGIAKIALGSDGKLSAELVHGRLSVVTPEGIFETDRIGTLIERDNEGDVVTRTVTAEEKKQELDDEAQENIVEPEEADTPAAGEATADAEAETETGTEAGTTSAAEEAPVAAEATSESETQAEETGDVLVDNPLDNGLVEIGEDGKLEATAELVEIDPDAAKLINEGGVAIDESGAIVPTAKMLELDPTAQAMFDDGLLEVDENGFLVASTSYQQEDFYEEVTFQETDEKQVSDATLREFGFEEVEVLTTEDLYKSNLTATRSVLSGDETTAKLYEAGQLEIDENGLLKPSADFNPLLAARAEEATTRSQISFIDDNAADKLLLDTGVFDTKLTMRVVGTDLASVFYSEEVTQIVSADIVRDDALSAITILADANGLSLPDNVEDKKLEDLVALGGALSTRDALKTSIGVANVTYDEPVSEVDVTEDGEVVLRTIGVDGKIEETNADAALIDLASGSIDLALASQLVSEEELIALLPVIEASNEAKAESDDGKSETNVSSESRIAVSVEKDTETGLSSIALIDPDGSSFIDATGGEDFKTEEIKIEDTETGLSSIALIDPDGSSFIDATGGEDFKTEEIKIEDVKIEPTIIDTAGLDEKIVFAPELVSNLDEGNLIDFGKESFIGGLGEEFIDTAISGVVDVAYLDPVSDVKIEDYQAEEKVDLEPTPDEKDELVSKQVEDENDKRNEEVAQRQANTIADAYRVSLAGQRLAGGTSVWGSGVALYWSAYSSVNQYSEAEPVETRSNTLRLLGNGEVNTGFTASYADASGNENRVTTPVMAMGEATDLLAANSFKFKNTVDAIIAERNSSNEATQTTVRNDPATLQRKTRIEICDCDQVATGLWETEDFTDRALGNLTYRHKAHWAIGSPLDSDTLRSLAGMRATFSGHAYGTVATARSVAEGYGEVAVSVDFANPNDGSRNSWDLTNFNADNLSDTMSAAVELSPEFDNANLPTGHYGGTGDGIAVDGGVYGTLNNLQTAGTFTLNTPDGSIAISGSYAGEGAAARSPAVGDLQLGQ